MNFEKFQNYSQISELAELLNSPTSAENALPAAKNLGIVGVAMNAEFFNDENRAFEWLKKLQH